MQTLTDTHTAIARFKERLVQERDRLASLMTAETNKPITQSHNELRAMGPRIQFFLDHVQEAMATQVLDAGPNTRQEISYDPLGTIAHISAWNYPYFVSSNVVIPALLTGNTVLFKPSEYATQTGIEMVQLLHDCGIDPAALEVIPGGPDAGAELLQRELDGVFFTGSYRTGKAIADAVRGKMLHLQLELGGKDPAYIGDPCDPVALVEGAFYNAGQSCCAIERIYVKEDLYPTFIDGFVAEARRWQPGDPTSEATLLAPLARPQHIEFLEEQVQDAISKGAKLLLGGTASETIPGAFQPTVLTNVDHSMRIMTEESFGPIIGIQTVSDDKEAIRLMNDTTYGLTAAVYCNDEARGRNILGQLDTGTAYWNCCDRVSPDLPWSGRRNSGLGVTLSTAGIRTFLRPRAWHLNAPSPNSL